MGRFLLVFLLGGCHQAATSANDLGSGDVPDLGSAMDASSSSSDAASDGGGSTTDGSTVVADGGALSGLCIEDRWCWERPSLFGANLNGVWGSSFSDVWVVGDGGTILHWDGATWTRLTPLTPEPLYHVHGSGPSDVWAVGGRIILHFDGTAWSVVSGAPMTKGLLRTVYAVGKNDVWFAGDWFARLHFDGSNWSLTEDPASITARALVGFAANDVYVAGDGGNMLHWDGKTWSWSQGDFTSSSPDCTSFWGSGPDNIYLTCGTGADSVQHWDGKAWTRVTFPADVQPGPQVVVGSSANDVWLFSNDWNCAHWDGTTWTRQMQLEDDGIGDAWLDASGRGFGVGGAGRIIQHGTTWTDASGSKGGGYDSLGGVFALSDDDIWAVGRLSVLRYGAGAWNDVPAAMTTYREEFANVWASGPNDAWISGWGDFPNSLQRWNGTSFQVVPNRPDLAEYVDGIWGASANDVWIINDDGEPLHWDGSKLTNLAPNPGGLGTFGRVHGLAGDDVWIITGGLRHWDGKQLTQVTLPQPSPAPVGGLRLWDVHAVAANDVWVAGEDGYVARWNGSSWGFAEAPPLRPDLNGNRLVLNFAGVAANDLWAVGTGGDIFQFDGAHWRRSASVGTELSRLGRTPTGALLAVGGGGAILRRRP